MVCVMTGSYAGKPLFFSNTLCLTHRMNLHLVIAWFFLFAGAYMMAVWAIKKHKNYKKEFGKDYPRRNIMIPFIW